MCKRQRKLVFLTTFLILVLSSCVSLNQSKAHYNIVEGEKIKDSYYYDLQENFKGMTLEIDLELVKGEVEFQLVDPNGQVRWTELVDSSQGFKETREFEKVVGNWDLLFESIDQSAEGHLSLEFNRK